MIEVLFAAWLAVVGVLLLTPTSRWIPPWGAVFVAPLAATASFVITGLTLASVSFFSVALTVALVSIVALIVSVPCMWRNEVTLRWLSQALGGAVSIAVVVAVVSQRIPMVRLTTDSYHYLMSAVALVRSGTLEGVNDSFLLKRQLATPLLHTLGVETGRGYVSFWTPLLGVSTFGSMTWLASDGLRAMSVPQRWRWAIVVPALVFVLTSNRVIYHFFYINGHMLFAGLLLVGVGLGWMAVRDNSWILFVPASLSFGAMIPLRPESAIVAGAFLLVFVTSVEIPLRWRWILVIPFSASTLLWDGWVLPRQLSSISLELMRSPLAEMGVVIGLIIVLLLSSIRRINWMIGLVPWLAIGALGVGLAALVWRDSQVMLDTIVGMSSAMTVTGFWGTFWMVVPVLFFAAIIVGFPRDRYVVIGLLAFTLIIPVLGYLRGGAFGDHPGDSANRMIMHVVPLLMLVIILAAGRAAGWATKDDGGVSKRDEPVHGTAAGAVVSTSTE